MSIKGLGKKEYAVMAIFTGKRYFSELKLIKNFLCSSLCQKRFNSLSIMATENHILAKFNCQDVLNEFVPKKFRGGNI